MDLHSLPISAIGKLLKGRTVSQERLWTLRIGAIALMVTSPLIVAWIKGRSKNSNAANIATADLPWWGTLLASIAIVAGAIGLFAWWFKHYG